MGNCGSLYTPAYCEGLSENPLDADADIVGPGVLAGFGLTALLTMMAIVVGYFTDSLPDKSNSKSDDVFIETIKASRLARLGKSLRSHLVEKAKKIPYLLKYTRSKEALSKTQRQEMLEKFILALSDQQLVTGIAVLAATFSAHCRISVYEFNVAVSLAWFSSATHLATLDILRDYLRRNGAVRNLRMVGMVSIVLLLIAGLVLTAAYDTNNIIPPIQCHSIVFNVFSFISNGAAIVYLVLGYVNRLSRTYASEERPFTRITRLSLIGLLIVSRRWDARDSASVVDKAIRTQELWQADENEILVRKATSNTTSMFTQYTCMFSICWREYSETFAQKLESIFFMLSYGWSQVAVIRWPKHPPQLDPKSNRMDFGQVVPLVLLIIPGLTAAEIFWEAPKEAKQSSKKDLESNLSAEISVQQSGRHSEPGEALLAPSSDNTAAAPRPYYVATAAGTDNDLPSATNGDASSPEIQNRVFVDSTNLEVQAHRETSPDQPKVFSSGTAIAFIFTFRTILNIGVGVFLNLDTFGFISGAVGVGGMVLIFGYDWFLWFRRLFKIIGAILAISRDKKFDPRSAVSDTEGHSTEMYRSSNHSLSEQWGSYFHARSSQPAPTFHAPADSVARTPDADETESTPLSRQDTEARIGDKFALPSISITRRRTVD